ncbi:class I SAM-dependent methyltransferase [Haliangium sp. UPWRP_2]|uniref:class I SAM-dependent methyltransferase n=1 Tax=Haliangium sp. UPWRP_2 TaxID=1931276 RepID=UPI000D0D71D9|nr:class I SAM-dependent methyltransferase [Haliangium sp. UPWRP_2]PSM31750.1 hypothetical protein BVG81_003815 [Haliangium sp. UPWRP_2]
MGEDFLDGRVLVDQGHQAPFASAAIAGQHLTFLAISRPQRLLQVTVGRGVGRLVKTSIPTYGRFRGIEELWQDYATAVYPHDDLELSLRCRFFLERIQSFGEGHREPVFINIASGFTSYPFLIQPHYISAECDYGHIIEFKQGQLSQWQQAGILPERDVRYFPADLNSPESLQLLLERMQAISQGRPSFILMEGITYYWEAARLHEFLGGVGHDASVRFGPGVRFLAAEHPAAPGVPTAHQVPHRALRLCRTYSYFYR